MKSLPLFYYPTTCIWVDDEKSFLDTMTHVFSDYMHIIPFQTPDMILEYLKKYQSPLSKYKFLLSNEEDENYGLLKKTPVDFDITKIINLSQDQNRHSEISVIVIDYHMPEMDGISLAEKLEHTLPRKILLTGSSVETKAIEAFNKNLIDRFVQKTEDGMAQKILAYLSELSFDYFEKRTRPLLAHIETEAPLPQSDPVFIAFFKNYCRNNGIVEYYLIDKQGSYFCRDSNNNSFCLIIHSEYSLDSWLDMYQNESNFKEADYLAIKERKKIPFFGIGKEAWEFPNEDWSKHLYQATLLEGRERYFFCNIPSQHHAT